MAELPQPLERYHPLVEEELRAILGDNHLPLYRMMRYQLGWVESPEESQEAAASDRFRSTLCLLACHALGADVTAAIPAAAAVDLVHNYYLVHTDIQGGAPQRNGRSTVWWLWGPAQGINVGDGMHAMGRLSLFRLRERGLPAGKVLWALQALDDASLRLCEGRFQDLSFKERMDVTEQQYWQMAERKGGALTGCAMELGAIVASEDTGVVNAFRSCGQKLGMALQLVEDLQGLWGNLETGRSMPSDEVLSLAKPLPVVYALAMGTVAQKMELGSIYFKRTMEPEDVARLMEVLDGVGARRYVQGRAQALASEALSMLEGKGVTGAGLAELREVADFIVRDQRVN